MVQNSQPPAVAAEPITTHVLLQEMDLHWANNAGLRANTRKRYLTQIRRFLTAQFPAGEIDWAAVTPTAIAGFVTIGASTSLQPFDAEEPLHGNSLSAAVCATEVLVPQRDGIALAQTAAVAPSGSSSSSIR